MLPKPLLLVRPHPAENEEVAEYLQRLAKVNGFRGVNAITTILQTPINCIVVKGHLKLLEVISGASNSATLRLTERNSPILSPYRDSVGASSNARVCVSCLRTSDVLEGEWSKPLSIGCRHHNELLVDHCPKCSRVIVRRESQYRCGCGLWFQDIETQRAPIWLKRFYNLFAPWRNLGQVLTDQNPQALLEISSSRILYHVLNSHLHKTGHKPHSTMSWLNLADLPAIDELCADGFDLNGLVLNAINPNISIQDWGRVSKAICGVEPGIYRRYVDAAAERRRQKLIAAMKKRYGHSIARNTTRHLAFSLGIDRKAIARCLCNTEWQKNVLQIGGVPGNIEECVANVVENTYSSKEIASITGIPSRWLKLYFDPLPDGSLKTTSKFHTWRIPKAAASQLIEGIQNGLRNVQDIGTYSGEFIHLREISASSEYLPRIILQRVAKGNLKLLTDSASPGDLISFLDCAIPVREITRPATPIRAIHTLRSLTRFSGSR